MTDPTPLPSVFRWQAEYCRGSGSPLSEAVLRAVANGLGQGVYEPFLAPWAEADAKALWRDAVPLRLLGGFHYLALSGASAELAGLYAEDPAVIEAGRLAEALAQAARAHSDALQSFMASPPQTNEVGRSFALVGGFLTVAAETGLPLRCLELGASAGLNMNWDRYGYRFGEQGEWGDPASPVTLSGSWHGAAPPLVSATVVERRACDQAPIDVSDPDRALRLQSYVWPGQTERLARLRAAIDLKRHTGGAPERADAADWAEAHVHPEAGVATVVYHSVFLQYPPQAIQDRIVAAIHAAGARATRDAPLAWLSMEVDPEGGGLEMAIRLTLWPSGATRTLARTHPHGASVRWLGGA